MKRIHEEEIAELGVKLEAHLRRNWVLDAVVVLTLLVLAAVAWEKDWGMRAILTLGAAFYYCGKGDGERRVAKRTLNYIDGYDFHAGKLDGSGSVEGYLRDRDRKV